MADSPKATVSKFTFKSVGSSYNDRKYDNTAIKQTLVRNIGIKTPVQWTGKTEIFDMHTDPREQLKDNLKNLVMTNHGERLCNHSFGANLKSILYDYTKEREYKEMATALIIRAVDEQMPMVAVTEVQSIILNNLEKNNVNAAGLAKLKLRVIFGVPKLRIENLAVEIEMFIGG